MEGKDVPCFQAKPAPGDATLFGLPTAVPRCAVVVRLDSQVEGVGVDPRQPQTLLAVPQAPVLDQLLAAWRVSKKTSDITLVFDKSGSMGGRPLTQAKAGARAFLDGLGPRDTVSLLFFDSQLYPVLGPRSGAERATLAAEIDGTSAGGGTALYDAVIAAYDAAMQRARAAPGQIHALVVMTDGQDERSRASLEAVKHKLAGEEEAPVKVFTIAYGRQAAGGPLAAIAEAGRGSASAGSVDDIVQVYRDIASFF